MKNYILSAVMIIALCMACVAYATEEEGITRVYPYSLFKTEYKNDVDSYERLINEVALPIKKIIEADCACEAASIFIQNEGRFVVSMINTEEYISRYCKARKCDPSQGHIALIRLLKTGGVEVTIRGFRESGGANAVFNRFESAIGYRSPSSELPRYCSSCGKSVDEGARFCKYCGIQLK